MVAPVSESIPAPKDLIPKCKNADYTREKNLKLQQDHENLEQCHTVRGIVHSIFQESSISGASQVLREAHIDRPKENYCIQDFFKELQAKGWFVKQPTKGRPIKAVNVNVYSAEVDFMYLNPPS